MRSNETLKVKANLSPNELKKTCVNRRQTLDTREGF